MSVRAQLLSGLTLAFAGVCLMIYAYHSLYGMPWVMGTVFLWVTCMEYAVLRACWVDARHLRHVRMTRRHQA